MKQDNSDKTATWAYGKAIPGWYCARWIWNQAYKKHLESLGYRVQRSVKKPQD